MVLVYIYTNKSAINLKVIYSSKVRLYNSWIYNSKVTKYYIFLSLFKYSNNNLSLA